MTRINTNISSLTAQRYLHRSYTEQRQAMTRLSSGLRINTGADDPAGLITSDNLRSDIIGVNTAIDNNTHTNQIFNAAGSALGQINNLLIELKAMVTEAANTGVMDPDQIAANQLLVDQSIESINRISRTTEFNGLPILDGGYAFSSTVDDVPEIQYLQINSADLSETGMMDVNLEIVQAATSATITTTVPDVVDAVAATGVAAFPDQTVLAVAAEGVITFRDEGGSNDIITLTVDSAQGDRFNDKTVTIVESSTSVINGDPVTALAPVVELDAQDNMIITVKDGATTAMTAIATAISTTLSASDGITAVASTNGAPDGDWVSGTDVPGVVTYIGDPAYGGTAGVTGGTGQTTLTISASAVGTAPNGVEMRIRELPLQAPGTASVTIDGNGDIVVSVFNSGTTEMSVIAAAINDLDGYNAVAVTTDPADGLYEVGRDTSGGIGGTQTFAEMGAEPPGIAGVDAAGGIEEDIVIQLGGVNGTEVIRFEVGTSGEQMVEGIQMAQDVTGVTAAYDGVTGVLTFSAVDQGAEGYVEINMLEGGAGTTFMNDLSAYRAHGTDTDAKINGVTAGSRGNEIWLRQSTLDTNMIVEPDTIGEFTFTITGGGALLQLGAVVESAQQVRIGVPGINSGSLGGISGWLYEVVSGGGADLAEDPSRAYKIIEEAITQVASIEGQFGAIQRTLIDPKIETLSDSVVNLTEMESSIRDADFAKETAALTRSQILIEAGTQILTVANKNPEQVLQLLR